ncbi:MAG: hypothetical protein MAG453_01096 [Calditrichaeota bacterium]|nr:hypothetical protein [Calditrichota bacterium]
MVLWRKRTEMVRLSLAYRWRRSPVFCLPAVNHAVVETASHDTGQGDSGTWIESIICSLSRAG